MQVEKYAGRKNMQVEKTCRQENMHLEKICSQINYAGGNKLAKHGDAIAMTIAIAIASKNMMV